MQSLLTHRASGDSAWPRIAQIIPAPPGWAAVHADLSLDEYQSDGEGAPPDYLLSTRCVVGFALLDQDDRRREPVLPLVGTEFSAVGLVDGFAPSDELASSFLGYLRPGQDLEDFRGAAEDHYEAALRHRDVQRAEEWFSLHPQQDPR